MDGNDCKRKLYSAKGTGVGRNLPASGAPSGEPLSRGGDAA